MNSTEEAQTDKPLGPETNDQMERQIAAAGNGETMAYRFVVCAFLAFIRRRAHRQ